MIYYINNEETNLVKSNLIASRNTLILIWVTVLIDVIHFLIIHSANENYCERNAVEILSSEFTKLVRNYKIVSFNE